MSLARPKTSSGILPNPSTLTTYEMEETAMRAPGRAGIATWAVLTLGSLSYPEIALAQLRGVFGQRGTSNSSEMAPGFGGTRGDGALPMPGPFPFVGGMERQGQGRRPQREFDAPNGPRRPFNNANPSNLNSGQPYQAADGTWYYPDGRPNMTAAPRPGANAGLPYQNAGQPYQAGDGNWYYPDGRPYTAAQPAANAAQPYLAVDGKWYYPDGRPYTAANAQPAANAGQPYQAVDGNWYYPDGRPYTTTAAQPAAPTSTTAATPSPSTVPETATPAANVIPDLERPVAVANNIVRTRLPAARSTVREELAQELSRSLEEGIDRMESSLRAALFSEADEAAFLGIYKRSFTEDTPQFRLARKNIKYLDADELRQGLIIDQIVDAGAQVYPAKLELSAKFGTFKREVLGGRSSAEFDQAAKGLLKTYERIARSPEFTDMSVPDPDQVRAEVSGLRCCFEVRHKLAESREAAAGSMVTMDKRFWIVSYPGLPKDTVHAIDPQVCLCGTGTGTIGARDAGLLDLGVPLLNRVVSPLPEIPRPSAPSGAVVYNPKTSPATVHYVTDGASYELKPGQSRTHQVTANSRITYDRGGTLGNITYQLSAGTYRFSIEDRTWQLTKPSFSVVIDNSANGCDFQCDIDGQPKVIPARKTLEVASNYPISIRFDREEGQPASCKLIDETPRVTIGVAPGSAALDLFPGSSQELCIRPVASDAIASLPQPELATPARVGRQPVLPTVEDLQ